MTVFFTFIHVIVCLLLGVIILMQSGRGGGLTEGFASAGEMFGAKTNAVLIRATTIFSCIFFVTCLTLAILSAQRGKSLMSQAGVEQTQTSAPLPAPSEEVPLGDLPDAPGTPAAQ